VKVIDGVGSTQVSSLAEGATKVLTFPTHAVGWLMAALSLPGRSGALTEPGDTDAKKAFAITDRSLTRC
jgi:hypothetical protein